MEQVLACLPRPRDPRRESNASGPTRGCGQRRCARRPTELGPATCASRTSRRRPLGCRGNIDRAARGGQTFTNLDTGETFDSSGWRRSRPTPPRRPASPLRRSGRRCRRRHHRSASPTPLLVVGPRRGGTAGRTTDDPATIGSPARSSWSRHRVRCAGHGGNYAFFQVLAQHVGFPWPRSPTTARASSAKHPARAARQRRHGHRATALAEIGGPANQLDVTAMFDTIALEQVGPDRAHQRRHGREESVSGSGEGRAQHPRRVPQQRVLVLTGLDYRGEEADLACARSPDCLDAPERHVDGSTAENQPWRPRCAQARRCCCCATVRIPLTRPTQARRCITVKASGPRSEEGRQTVHCGPIVEEALATYPGMFPTTPRPRAASGVYWPTTVPDLVTQDGDTRRRRRRADGLATVPSAPVDGRTGCSRRHTASPHRISTSGVRRSAPFGAERRTSGGEANVGAGRRGPAATPSFDRRAAWRCTACSALRRQYAGLLPGGEGLDDRGAPLPNLHAVNVDPRLARARRRRLHAARPAGREARRRRHLRARIVELPRVALGGDA